MAKNATAELLGETDSPEEKNDSEFDQEEIDAEFDSAFDKASGEEEQSDEEQAEEDEEEIDESEKEDAKAEEPEAKPLPKAINAILGKYSNDAGKIAAAKASSDQEARRMAEELRTVKQQLAEIQNQTKSSAPRGTTGEMDDEALAQMMQDNPLETVRYLKQQFQTEVDDKLTALGTLSQKRSGVERALLGTFPELQNGDSPLLQQFQRFAAEGRIPMENEEDALIYTMGLKAIFDSQGIDAVVTESEKKGAAKQKQKSLQAKRAFAEGGGGTAKPGARKNLGLTKDELEAAKFSGLTPEEYAFSKRGTTRDLMKSFAKKGKK